MILQVSMIQTLCFLLETLLTPDTTPPDTHKDVYELYFVFAAIWAFGGFLFKDEVCMCTVLHLILGYTCNYAYLYTCMQMVDYRVEFSKWWVAEFKHIKFPSQGTIFDYFLDHTSKKWLHWGEKVPKFTLDSELPLQVI